jgi:hypothetical protein
LTVASTAARFRRVGDEADLDRPHQADHTQHRGIVSSSTSGALYGARASTETRVWLVLRHRHAPHQSLPCY